MKVDLHHDDPSIGSELSIRIDAVNATECAAMEHYAKIFGLEKDPDSWGTYVLRPVANTKKGE